MPHKNGFALADAINRVFETKKIPIIAMSNIFKDEFKWLMDFYGIKRWIKKPFLPLDVIWAVENEMQEDIQSGMESAGGNMLVKNQLIKIVILGVAGMVFLTQPVQSYESGLGFALPALVQSL